MESLPPDPPRRPLVTDVAAAAGVSAATVDRVLNRRRGVRKATVARVLAAAARLGYLSPEELAGLQGPAPQRLVFLLPSGSNPYLRHLGARVRELAERAPENARVRCFFVEGFNPAALAEALQRFGAEADGVAFMAMDHPLVREAAERLAAEGRRVVTIVSDLSGARRLAYIGIDNTAAGRTAAFLLGRFSRRERGRVAVIAASRVYRAHQEREWGFLGLCEELFPGLRVIGAREGHDDRDENYRHARSLLEQHADLVGLYNVGGSSDGIGRALRESGRKGEVVFIGHGLTADTRAMLIEGLMDAVITQDPDAIIARALTALAAPPEAVPPSGVPMEIYFRENLPPLRGPG